MAYTCTIAPGLSNVCLPNGNIYQGGDVAILSDEQYGQMVAATRDTVFSEHVIVTVPAA